MEGARLRGGAAERAFVARARRRFPARFPESKSLLEVHCESALGAAQSAVYAALSGGCAFDDEGVPVEARDEAEDESERDEAEGESEPVGRLVYELRLWAARRAQRVRTAKAWAWAVAARYPGTPQWVAEWLCDAVAAATRVVSAGTGVVRVCVSAHGVSVRAFGDE